MECSYGANLVISSCNRAVPQRSMARNMQFKHLFLTITALLTLPFTAFAQEHTLLRHGSSVQTIAYSPTTPSLFASAGDNGEIKLWDLQNDTVTTFRGHTNLVNAMTFSPNGRWLVSGSDDYTFRVWDVSQRIEIRHLQHISDRTLSQIKSVAFSPNGRLLATAGVHLKLWDTGSWSEIATLRHAEWVWAVAFSPDGTLIATGDASGQVNVWNVQSQRTVTQLHADSDAVYTVRFSPNAQILASAGYEGQIQLWNIQNWGHLGTLRVGATAHAIRFSPDSRLLASTGYETVDLWSVGTGEKTGTLTSHSGWVKAAAFFSDGGFLISGGEDETLRIWDITPYRSASQAMVRIVYFLPRDRSIQPGIWQKLDTRIRNVQRFYADQMEINGFGRKTFTYETDNSGNMLVYRVDGQFRDRYYHRDTAVKVHAEIASQFDMGRHVYLIVADISSEFIGETDKCGIGGGDWYKNENLIRGKGGHAVIPASGPCFDGAYGNIVTAHELGHAFGLEHDFHNDAYVMSYGAAPDRLSKCATSWLDAHRLFNTDQTAFDAPTTIQLLTPTAYLPNARNLTLQFEVTDADGIHQVQLLVPTTATDPAPGAKLHSCKNLNTQSSALEFSTPTLTTRHINDIVLQVIDVYGNITRQNYTLKANNALLSQNRVDVNRDGTVNIADLVLVASNFGKTIKGQVNRNPDVNRDGVVNIADLLLVASSLHDISAAPTLYTQRMHALTATDLQNWIKQAKNYDIHVDSSHLHTEVVKRGVVALEQLLTILTIPTETRLLANYPNPFNPETWIPYQLSEPAEVTLHIYSMDGTLVRTLALGYRSAGRYHSKNGAAYWDGRNEQGERTASGVYFYTLSAGDFTATRKMLIRK